MNKSRLIATFVIALLIAGAVSIYVLQKLKRSSMKASASTYQVVVAAKDLEIGAKLAEGDLKLLDWVAGSPAQGAFTKIDAAVGRAVLYPIYQNELVLEAKLAAAGSGAGLPAVIPNGMRAVSIRVDDVIAVAGFVGPGAHVDVMLTGRPSGAHPGEESLTRTILENIQVLAAGQKIQPDAQGRAEKVNVVTLLCNPQDAAKLTLAANDGHIQLVLRNPVDTLKAEKEASVGRGALYGGTPPKPAPAPRVVRTVVHEPVVAPPPPEPPPMPVRATIEMVRGEKVSTVELVVPGSQGGKTR